MYVGGQYSLAVFGIGRFTTPPSIGPTNYSFTSSLAVTITETESGATVRYTLDGSAPSINSPSYTEPFVLTNTTLVQARAFRPNSTPSPVASAAFGLVSCAYEAAVSRAAPVAYWRFNEAAPNPAYDYAGGQHGRYGLGCVSGIAGPQGPEFPGFETNNLAVQFSGLTPPSYVLVPALNLDSDSVTITAWVNPYGSQVPYAGLFIAAWGSVPGLSYTLGDQLGYIWNGNTTWQFQSGLEVPTNQWSFVAVVVEPDQAAVYLCERDGFSSATNAVEHVSEAWDGVALIGEGPGGSSRVFNGLLDEVEDALAALFGGHAENRLRFGRIAHQLGVGAGDDIALQLNCQRRDVGYGEV